MSPESLRRDALAIHAAGIAAADPARCLQLALVDEPAPAGRPWILALGKAGPAMAAALAAYLKAHRSEPAGGIVVAAEPGPEGASGLPQVAGDHPVPGDGSLRAAQAIGLVCGRVAPQDEAWVLLSGGTSSLVAAPVPQIPGADFLALHQLLGAVGLPIGKLNAVRKRFSRWSAGRLLLAIPAHRVRVFCLSDVPGDNPADIGSGPCEPDPTTAAEVREILERADLWTRLPMSVRVLIDRIEQGLIPETPKRDNPAFRRRATRIVGSNRTAVAGAAAAARQLGYETSTGPEALTGEAAPAGRRLAHELLVRAERLRQRVAIIWGGETTVTLGARPGQGGRCQELALAAAGTLAGARIPSALLAAGTDGRDGPTDAAGAIVDPSTWRAIGLRSGDPSSALAHHDAYPSLDQVGALIRTGPTGTNVMDLVIGLADGSGQNGGAPAGER